MDGKGSTLARVVGLLGTVAFVLSLVACKYEGPITSEPTRPVDARLVQVWVTEDGKETLHAGKWDNSHYVVYYDGEFYRAFHSDVGQAAFVSVQGLDGRRYTYMKYLLADDGRRLTLWTVSEKVIPEGTKDPVRVRELLEKNATNPALLEDPVTFIKR